MKRKTASFTGTRPIFTGSPAIVMGGFNLDKDAQNFRVGDVIPAGTLAIRDEETRKVQVIKTAKVLEIDADDKKKLTLYVDEFYAPCFAEGDYVVKAGAFSGAKKASTPTITRVIENENTNLYQVVLSAEISGLAKGDVIVEGVESSDDIVERGQANSVTIKDVTVSEFETGIDVSADTMQYALYERRVPPITDSQKDETGSFLKVNPHVKLTKSH